MKTYNLDEASAEFDRLHPSIDCVCERIVASKQVHAVKPLRPTLEDTLADCEALNDEIEHLRAVAQRAQQREVEAVKRCEELERSLFASRALCDMIRVESQLLKNKCEKLEAKISGLQFQKALKGHP